MMQSDAAKPCVIFLMGPTTSGKTQLAISIYRKLPVEIISVDSAMVYRDLDIGTAKPAPDILEQVPHHLINVCDPAEKYSAGKFREDAMFAISSILDKGKIPLLVGGTGLYFRSLEQGMSDLPGSDFMVRTGLEQETARLGNTGMHRKLAKIDPVAARRIHPNDPQRVQRALEVYELTGKTLTEIFAAGRHAPLPFAIRKIMISPAERRTIHQRIEARFNDMLARGLVDEVAELKKRRELTQDLPSMRLVGYRQVYAYLEGQINYETMRERAIVATRQLAKRQMTWLRSEQNGHWIKGENGIIEAKVLKFLRDDPIF